MKRPLWNLRIERTTNAPFEVVAAALQDPEHRRNWHPRPGGDEWTLLAQTQDSLALEEVIKHPWGVEERADYRVTPLEGGLLLSYQVRFKGWPVLFLMGYWRLRSHRIWERFVESL